MHRCRMATYSFAHIQATAGGFIPRDLQGIMGNHVPDLSKLDCFFPQLLGPIEKLGWRLFAAQNAEQ